MQDKFLKKLCSRFSFAVVLQSQISCISWHHWLYEFILNLVWICCIFFTSTSWYWKFTAVFTGRYFNIFFTSFNYYCKCVLQQVSYLRMSLRSSETLYKSLWCSNMCNFCASIDVYTLVEILNKILQDPIRSCRILARS